MSNKCKNNRGIAWCAIIFLVFMIQYIFFHLTSQEVKKLRGMLHQQQAFVEQNNRYLLRTRTEWYDTMETRIEHLELRPNPIPTTRNK